MSTSYDPSDTVERPAVPVAASGPAPRAAPAAANDAGAGPGDWFPLAPQQPDPALQAAWAQVSEPPVTVRSLGPTTASTAKSGALLKPALFTLAGTQAAFALLAILYALRWFYGTTYLLRLEWVLDSFQVDLVLVLTVAIAVLAALSTRAQPRAARTWATALGLFALALPVWWYILVGQYVIGAWSDYSQSTSLMLIQVLGIAAGAGGAVFAIVAAGIATATPPLVPRPQPVRQPTWAAYPQPGSPPGTAYAAGPIPSQGAAQEDSGPAAGVAQSAPPGWGPAPTFMAAPLPTVTTTVVITALFGLFGIIPAAIHSSRASQLGAPSGKYWAAFALTFVVSIVVWFALVIILNLAIVGAVGGSTGNY